MPTTCRVHATPDRFLLRHALGVPAALALAALVVRAGGVDELVSRAFFDTAANGFPLHASLLLDTFGHRVAKSAVLGLWLALLGAALASALLPSLRTYRSVAWTTVIAMALGPSIVVLLKDLNAYRCPWDLKQFGGIVEQAGGWFVSSVNAGHCFPSGHAAGGFSLVALYFAGRALGERRLQLAGLAAALITGTAFSLVRIAQGAHFLSHNLWSAAIDWCAAALVFAPVLMSVPRATAPATVLPARPAGTLPASKSAPGPWRRIVRAARCSLAGLHAAWQREAAFRQEAVATAVLAPIALVAGATWIERCALLASLALVLIVELLNSAIEAAVDLACPQHHALAGFAKDAGSAAVLLSLLVGIGVWLAVLLPAR